MNQLKESASQQVNYLGRWVSKNNFRVFVYALDDRQKLVTSYEQYETAIKSGEWFASKDECKPKPIKAVRKAKDGTNS